MSMMLLKNESYVVRDVKIGTKKTTGEPFALVKIAESDNCDNKSKRIFKCWGDTVPTDIRPGVKATLIDFTGAGIKDEVIGEMYGEKKFKSCEHFVGCEWVLFVEPEAEESK